MNYSWLSKEFTFFFFSFIALALKICHLSMRRRHCLFILWTIGLHFGGAGPRYGSEPKPPRLLRSLGHNGAVLALLPAAHGAGLSLPPKGHTLIPKGHTLPSESQERVAPRTSIDFQLRA